MGLITKEVEVGLSGRNIKHYRSLGYIIPTVLNKDNIHCTKFGEKIKVKVSDLTKGSKVFVEVICDCCGKKLKVKYEDYINHNHNGKYYCHPCANNIFNSGENNNNWNADKTDEERENGRKYLEYTYFIKRVLARDKYTCQCCGNKGQNLEVHHLDGYEWCKEKRTDDTNGITLCHNCHKNFHSIYGNGGNTKEQFDEWFGSIIKLLKYNEEITPTRKVYCIETNTVYRSVKEVCMEFNIKSENSVRDVCHRKYMSTHKLHFLWYEDYVKMSEQDIIDYYESCKFHTYKKRVICLNTMEVFDTSLEAAKKYSGNKYINKGENIHRACKTGSYAYILNDGTKLRWMYYEDYLQKVKEYGIESIQNNKFVHKLYRKNICVTTGKVFNTIKEGADEYNFKSVGRISAACKLKREYAGKLSDGTPLKWMYYEDFLKLPIEEQNEILSRNKNSESSNDGSFLLDKEAV